MITREAPAARYDAHAEWYEPVSDHDRNELSQRLDIALAACLGVWPRRTPWRDGINRSGGASSVRCGLCRR
jgi:hypothetical protein